MKIIYFATSNRDKFIEAKEILARYNIDVIHFLFEYREIRSDNLEEIALNALAVAYTKIKKPVFVEDSGLFINVLNGFPGTYSGWVFKKIGAVGILDIMKGKSERSAAFMTCIAFNDETATRTFLEKCDGSISYETKGEHGFGYDSIFIPNGKTQTFAQSIELKNTLSHRYKALKALANYINSKL